MDLHNAIRERLKTVSVILSSFRLLKIYPLTPCRLAANFEKILRVQIIISKPVSQLCCFRNFLADIVKPPPPLSSRILLRITETVLRRSLSFTSIPFRVNLYPLTFLKNVRLIHGLKNTDIF